LSNSNGNDGYDDLRQQADEPKPESWKAEKAGDEIAGLVVKLDSAFDREGTEHGIVVLKTGDGTLRSVWLLGEVLVNQTLKVSPQPGDRLLIQYRGKVKNKTSGRMYHDFRVVTDRQVSTWWDRAGKNVKATVTEDEPDALPEPNPFDDEDPPF
jgi:hypothetical protein